MSTPARLPANLVIDNRVHCQAYRDDSYIVYQNYRHYTDDGLRAAGPDTAYHLFEIVHEPGESEQLGQKLGSFSNLDGAINRVHQLATQ